MNFTSSREMADAGLNTQLLAAAAAGSLAVVRRLLDEGAEAFYQVRGKLVEAGWGRAC